MLNAQVWNIERRRGHIVRAHLMTQWAVPLGTRQRKAIQPQLIALVFINVVQHVVKNLEFEMIEMEIKVMINILKMNLRRD